MPSELKIGLLYRVSYCPIVRDHKKGRVFEASKIIELSINKKRNSKP